MTMTLARRRALLDWAVRQNAYIIEDDYLGELQLQGRAAPALASIDHAGRVLHVGTFSKTISPSLRLGFMVVPAHLALTFAETAACLAPAPNVAVQQTVAEFIREGHYLRHLRKMKRLYAARRQRLADTLRDLVPSGYGVEAHGGFAVRLILSDGCDDVAVAERALQYGLAPVPLSPWYLSAPAPRGLLLGATNYAEADAAEGLLQAPGTGWGEQRLVARLTRSFEHSWYVPERLKQRVRRPLPWSGCLHHGSEPNPIDRRRASGHLRPLAQVLASG